MFRKFGRIFCYCIPNSQVYKKTLVKMFKNGQKLYIDTKLKLYYMLLY